MAQTMACSSLIVLALVCGNALASAEEWFKGRATYYGASPEIASAFDPERGEGSFGILAYGACGYTNLPSGDIPFEPFQMAASADQNPGYPGSCGRCYTVRCKPGPVLDNDGQPIRIIYPFFENGTQSSVGYFNGDYLRPYLPSINSEVKDSFGKEFPGNPGHKGPTGDSEDGGILDVQCDASKTVTVIIADSCPCKQVLSEDAPGVAPGGEVRRQEWCCGPTAPGGPTSHFDISWRAMEYLAHPLWGAINLEYVPVDCETSEPIEEGYISTVLYSRRWGIEPGWSWFPYSVREATLHVKGAGAGAGPQPSLRPGRPTPRPGVLELQDTEITPGTFIEDATSDALYAPTATCVSLTEGGGLSWRCRNCSQDGFQPFDGAQAIHFSIKLKGSPSNDSDASAVPAVKLFVMVDELIDVSLQDGEAVGAEEKEYCNVEAFLDTPKSPPPNGKLQAGEDQGGGWVRFKIPFSLLECEEAGTPVKRLNRIDFQNVIDSDVEFCLTDLEIVK